MTDINLDELISGQNMQSIVDEVRQIIGKASEVGLIQEGNIDIFKRPSHKNKDGSISTVRSISIGTDLGEVLIPTISPKGELLSDEEAISLYRKTGQHLGIFSTPERAEIYAEELHRQQESFYRADKK